MRNPSQDERDCACKGKARADNVSHSPEECTYAAEGPGGLWKFGYLPEPCEIPAKTNAQHLR